MSRARNLKPGFFKNEELADLPFEFRILFQGLWCIADRDGRLEDRPRKIKAEVFPYDDVDVTSGLDALAAKGFITRYAHGESSYIQVLAFAKHQNPHCKESASTIPAPGGTVQAQCKHGASPEITGTSPADSLNLIPDSLNPVPGDERPRSADADWFPNVSPPVIADFRKLRTAKKAPITQTAVDGIAREAAKASLTLESALRMCCERGWTGFKAEWVTKDQSANASRPGGGRKEL